VDAPPHFGDGRVGDGVGSSRIDAIVSDVGAQHKRHYDPGAVAEDESQIADCADQARPAVASIDEHIRICGPGNHGCKGHRCKELSTSIPIMST